ncbi:MAG TPA: DoxX family membrane protein [Actinotalea caeni]|uniref:DoxX family membrane protein n=1 Tax=Actinotalea caeni TaxID=1348467 RepID=UPI002B4ACF15|nr:DoxX family membrane protein [Actinotalea caeni]HLV55140.1 DoxX family membrane protein [Actinotalea caeni]
MSTWTTAPLPSQTPQRPPSRLVARTRDLLAAHSVTLLRVSLGLVFVAFGIPKLVPGLSPAEDLASATIEVLTLGLVGGQAAVFLTAVIETVIGLTLLTGRLLKVGLVMLAVALVGIMSPLVLFPDLMYAGGPSLEAQYVFKDIVLAAAGLVVGAHALGARLRTS